jgi:hypothetical protein
MYHDDCISGGVVKTMLDGVVEAHTAAMLTPYSDDPSQSRKLFWEPVQSCGHGIGPARGCKGSRATDGDRHPRR